MVVLTLCWAALAVWAFSLVVNLRLFVNPLFRAALIFEISAILGFLYLFYMAEELKLTQTEMKMLFTLSFIVFLTFFVIVFLTSFLTFFIALFRTFCLAFCLTFFLTYF